jgi:hypothetical protein
MEYGREDHFKRVSGYRDIWNCEKNESISKIFVYYRGV